jgi:uncharacterized protein with PCYCGC motif
MKKVAVILVLAVIAVFVVAWWTGKSQPPRSQSTAGNTAPLVDHSSHDSIAKVDTHQYAATGRVPAYQKPGEIASLPETLSPELFTGNIRLAYQAAREIPEVLAQLPCYCHCDRGHGHKSLHTCFESNHGENCGICIGEALMAYNLKKRGGLNAAQIRERIIAAYGQSEAE